MLPSSSLDSRVEDSVLNESGLDKAKERSRDFIMETLVNTSGKMVFMHKLAAEAKEHR